MVPTLGILPVLPAHTGCAFKGSMHGPTELSLDPRSPEGDFATASGGDGVVTLGRGDQPGEGGDAKGGRTAAVIATLSGYEFRVYARTAAISFFPQRRLTYQGIFEPFASTSLTVAPESADHLRIEVSAESGSYSAKFVETPPWVVACAHVGLAPGEYQAPEPKVNQTWMSTKGGLGLSKAPGGPALAELPESATFALLRVEGAYAYVRWAAHEGVYTGYVKRKAIESGFAGIGTGTGAGYGMGRTSCTSDVRLYVGNPKKQFFAVGWVRGGYPLQYVLNAKREVTPISKTDATPELFPAQPPAFLKLHPGYLLAVEAPAPGSCRAPPNVEPKAPVQL
jgi:hypothetical protein